MSLHQKGIADPVQRRNPISHFIILTKFPISLASALTAGLGYLVAWGHWDTRLLWIAAGTLLLGMGSGALNEVQECTFDALMDRTRQRPLPAGHFSPSVGTGVGCVLALAGFLVLVWRGGWLPASIGLLALVWYNGVYTPLKRKSALAVLPGSIIGALPPFIGWTAMGGTLLHPRILILGFLMLVWQIPHFWLLILLHGDDYERGGFPTLRQSIGPWGLSKLTLLWVGLLACSAPLLTMEGLVSNPVCRGGLGLASLALLVAGFWLLRPRADKRRFRRMFLIVNLFGVLAGMALLLDPLCKP